MYVISIKSDTKNTHPSAKKAKKRLFELSTHPSAENEKNTFFSKILSFLKIHEKSRFLEQIMEIFVIFFAFFNEKVVYARQRTVDIYVWKKFPSTGIPCT